MQSVFEKIIEKLDKERSIFKTVEWNVAMNKAIEIVKQAEAEYNGGWIPCSERVPNNYQIHEVTAKYNETVYTEFAYYDGVKDEWWKHDDDELVNVIAWKENSEPYKPEKAEKVE